MGPPRSAAAGGAVPVRRRRSACLERGRAALQLQVRLVGALAIGVEDELAGRALVALAELEQGRLDRGRLGAAGLGRGGRDDLERVVAVAAERGLEVHAVFLAVGRLVALAAGADEAEIHAV